MSPPIAWEREIDTIKIEREFKQIAEYCQQLLDAAADVLEQTWQAGWSVWQQTFPHIPDSHRAAVDLRAFLDLGSMAGYTLTPG
jgi:hypothetical protein